MKKTTYICDGCGREITRPEWYTVFYGITSSENAVTRTKELFEDICEDCMNGLKDVLQTGKLIRKPAAMKESSQQDVKKTPKKTDLSKKQPFDEGKARALRNAGWSLEKIADEMKCSPQTVANHLAKPWTPQEEAV
jgi:ribosome-binding protein aMBF1 (putative translation factor)